LGKTLTAAEEDRNIFTDSTKPEPNMGQYDLQPVLSQLPAEIPLELALPILNGEAINLSVPSSLVAEWQTVANY
jgi:hypothetical protein